MSDMPESNSRPPIPSDLVGSDADFADLIRDFVDSMPGRLAEMEAALAQQDFATLKVLAHRLKGSGGGYGYDILTRKGAELEQQAADALFEQCRLNLDELRDIASRLVVDAD